MRCFIGIELPDYIKENIYGIQGKIGNKYAKIKWVAKKNLHLTLKFLGETEEEELRMVKDALRRINIKKFKVEMGKIGWFPSDERINVIWIDLEPKKEIMDLHGETELKLAGSIEKDKRFEVHLTLGRVKLVKDKKKLIDAINTTTIKWDSFLVHEFCLVKSELSKDGPKYTVLERYQLH